MPNSKSAPTLADVQTLLQAYRNHIEAMERHAAEAERIKKELEKRLPPDSPLFDHLDDDPRN